MLIKLLVLFLYNECERNHLRLLMEQITYEYILYDILLVKLLGVQCLGLYEAATDKV